jgi:hypothetical protein
MARVGGSIRSGAGACFRRMLLGADLFPGKGVAIFIQLLLFKNLPFLFTPFKNSASAFKNRHPVSSAIL